MSSILANRRSELAETLQYFFWRHPEWWTLALSCLAWALMLLQAWQPGGHETHESMTFGREIKSWMLMVIAMMLPLVAHRTWLTAANSLWGRRHRAIAGFVVGYSIPWLLLGVGAAALRLIWSTHPYSAAGLCFVAAAFWQLTPMHRRGLVACHASAPLAPRGWQADFDCFRFGVTIGIACIRSCWPLMLACAFAGHRMIATTGSMLVAVSVRGRFQGHRLTILVGTIALAAYHLMLAAVN